MNDYAMFTRAGNLAVNEIVVHRAQQAEDHNQLYDLVHQDLQRLQTVSAFAEATDTEVREQVYKRCLREFSVPVFRSIRS